MHDSLFVPASVISGFLLVMARVGSATAFVPIPGFRTSPNTVRVVFSLATTFALFKFWPHQLDRPQDPVWFLCAMLAEAVFGIGIGLFAGFLTENLVMAFQIASLQAGYSYATTVDPTTQADAGYLPVLAQLAAGFFFFSFGVHREVLRALAFSLTTLPPGTIDLTHLPYEYLLRAAGAIFKTGLRLALPAVALLAMTDIVLALMGRLNSQLQVISLSFPVKMLLALATLAATFSVYTIAFGESARQMSESMLHLVR